MGYEKEIEAVEREWSFEDGFFWHLRQGHFSAGEFERTLAALGAISISDNAELPLRLVSLLWYGPVFCTGSRNASKRLEATW